SVVGGTAVSSRVVAFASSCSHVYHSGSQRFWSFIAFENGSSGSLIPRTPSAQPRPCHQRALHGLGPIPSTDIVHLARVTVHTGAHMDASVFHLGRRDG